MFLKSLKNHLIYGYLITYTFPTSTLLKYSSTFFLNAVNLIFPLWSCMSMENRLPDPVGLSHTRISDLEITLALMIIFGLYGVIVSIGFTILKKYLKHIIGLKKENNTISALIKWIKWYNVQILSSCSFTKMLIIFHNILHIPELRGWAIQ